MWIWKIVALSGVAILGSCSQEKDPADRTLHPDRIQPMLGAVMHSETEDVRRLAERHQGLEERNPDDHSTPMINAAETDQWPVVEILINHGADIWAHDEFGVTAASYTLDSRILRGSVEDQARLRVIDKLKARGYPFPPPDADQVLALDKAGNWPPKGAR